MENILLIDFGSTYTKITAVDINKEEIIGTASSYTTIDTDINYGLNNALKDLENTVGKIKFDKYFACSSAAGGLKMAVSGLVEKVTAQAAKEASLGAGAKVIKVYSYEMTEEDVEEIDNIKPEIFLLAGGTNGGDKKCILHNAKMLSLCKSDFPIIIAGNREASIKCKEILDKKETYLVENVMPFYGELNIEPAQQKIREIFLDKIIYAKGITKAKQLISGIMMPTPSAMMKAMELLANGYKNENGIGELMAIDLGGATTDVYSIGDGFPTEANVIYKGIKEPYVKRTVEGDIGMRYSISGIIEEVGINEISKLSNLCEERIKELINYLYLNPNTLPNEIDDLTDFDVALACKAVELASVRHAGEIEKVYTSNGVAYLQKGKDLRQVKQIIATGGSIIHMKKCEKIIKSSMYNEEIPKSLRPISADILIDKKYILAAMGLLSQSYPEIAIRIMKKELIIYGN